MFCASTRGDMIPNQWYVLMESRQVKEKRGLGVRAAAGQVRDLPPGSSFREGCTDQIQVPLTMTITISISCCFPWPFPWTGRKCAPARAWP